MSFDHRTIEKKWQEYWEKSKTFEVSEDPQKPKFYILDMYPYPSGEGLHVGHILGYTASDIVARYRRMRGYNVLHPMGWDSFGLPAEQFALRTGQHPQTTTERNIARYRTQLKAMGFSYDWSREFATSDQRYYKWTQWIFTLLFDRGLAYQAEILVNYCPELSAVLANEEVENGKSKEGGYPVVRRPLRQWILKITAYAERLLEDLKELEWPEALKRQQRNWIGKSLGVEVAFWQKETDQHLTVFTTRADTLMGVTFLALAPEHPLLDQCPPECKEAILKYREKTAGLSDLERTETSKEQTGVFSGLYATHPLTQEPIPLFAADYVLGSYGTGAVMGVPAHDERDFSLAEKLKLPIRPVVLPTEQDQSEFDLEKIKAGLICFAQKGILFNSNCSEIDQLADLDGLSSIEGSSRIAQWLASCKKGGAKTSYKLRDWLFSRQRYWGEPIPILHFADGSQRCLGLDELPLCPPHVADYRPDAEGNSPLAKVTDWVDVKDPKTGLSAKRETNTMPQWAGSCWYYLRYCDPHNDKAFVDSDKERYWLPVDSYVGGAEHAVLHLLYARFWHKVLFDCQLVSTKEPFRQLKNPGMITAKSYRLKSGKYLPPDQVKQSANGDAVSLETGEPLQVQEEKMSKSKLNGVNPDELLERFGADALRLYEMFMGPLDREKIWNTDAVIGCCRFLQRVNQLARNEKVGRVSDQEKALVLINQLIVDVEVDFEQWQFNTLIAKLMKFLNDFEALNGYPKECVEIFIKLLAPLAPHLAEELWELLGHLPSIANAPFPKADRELLQNSISQIITYIIQVDGKLRGRLELPRGTGREKLLDLALKMPGVAKFAQGAKPERAIFVPDKLLNIPVKK